MVNMKKICFILRRPALYREAIHLLLDKEFDCEWNFGDTDKTIKSYDISKLKSASLHHVTGDGKALWFYHGMIGKLFDKRYDVYVLSGSTRDISGMLFIFLRKLFFRNKRVYIWGHGWYGKESKLETAIKKWIFNSVTGYFVYGERSKKISIEMGASPNRVFAIHNSLHYDEQVHLRECLSSNDIYKDHFRNNNPVLIFIGRLTKVKQLDMILDALSILKSNGEAYNLVFVGDGTERHMLFAKTKELGLEESVWFYGECYDEATNAELLYNADLCVAPGNVGLTAMHTMVFGCPVVTHNDFKWQMPEYEAIISGVTGDFFERNSINSLADCISNWFCRNSGNREVVRDACYDEIDTNWNPYYQIEIFKKYLK